MADKRPRDDSEGPGAKRRPGAGDSRGAAGAAHHVAGQASASRVPHHASSRGGGAYPNGGAAGGAGAAATAGGGSAAHAGAALPAGRPAAPVMDALSFARQSERQTAFLRGWFERFGAKHGAEIEARIRGVGSEGFAAALKQLQSNPHWTKSSTVQTLDLIWKPSNIRETRTRAADGRTVSTFLRKAPMGNEDRQFVWFPAGGLPGAAEVKFQVSSELEAERPPATDRVELYRLKTRYSFQHKGMWLFELTTAHQSRESFEAARTGAPQFEVELEWCGQSRAAEIASPEVFRQSMVAKVFDLVQQSWVESDRRR